MVNTRFLSQVLSWIENTRSDQGLNSATWQFASANSLRFGRGGLWKIIGDISSLGRSRPMVVTDPQVRRLPLVDELLGRLLTHGSTVVFDECSAEPAAEIAVAASSKGALHDADVVIAIGGGSCIDVGKMAAVLMTHGGHPSDYFGFDRIPGPIATLIAVPTTAGTGSEVSHSAVLTDASTHIKVSTLSRWLRPTLAIVDPALTDTCPPKVTAESGIDALVHAIEAYTNRDYRELQNVDPQTKAYSGSYPLTQLLAGEAMRLISHNLPLACREPSNRAARDEMALAATYAGMAFSNSGVALVHALEYPLGTLTQCSHGEGNGLLLPHVMRFNMSQCLEATARVADFFCGQPANELKHENLLGRAERAIQSVVDLQQAIGIKTHLKDLGLKRELIPEVARRAFQIRRLMEINPRMPTESDLVSILESAY
jgi:alcohol dehydrogenase